jgi:NADH:ubiquinone oxidoreductase subunit 4 (subunit M)
MKNTQKHFQVIAVCGVILLGALGLIVGAICVFHQKDITVAVACVTVSSTALGTLGGVLTAQKLNKQPPDCDDPPDS